MSATPAAAETYLLGTDKPLRPEHACVVCGKEYPAKRPLKVVSGEAETVCSDQCERKYHATKKRTLEEDEAEQRPAKKTKTGEKTRVIYFQFRGQLNINASAIVVRETDLPEPLESVLKRIETGDLYRDEEGCSISRNRYLRTAATSTYLSHQLRSSAIHTITDPRAGYLARDDEELVASWPIIEDI